MSTQLKNGRQRATNGAAEPSKPAPAAGGDGGRDAGGRFASGNSGGPGNPFARRVAELRIALFDAVTPEDLRYLAGQLVVLAKNGDLAACKLLFSYVLGKPAPAVNPDALDWEELLQRFNCPPFAEALKKLLNHYRPDALVAVDRGMALAQQEQLLQRISKPGGLTDPEAAPHLRAVSPCRKPRTRTPLEEDRRWPISQFPMTGMIRAATTAFATQHRQTTNFSLIPNSRRAPPRAAG